MRSLFLRGMRLAILGILLAGVSPSPTRAQTNLSTAFSFLLMEPSARAASLGGAFSAIYGEDINALFHNPALLNPDMHRMLSVTYLNHLSNINAGFLAYGRHMEGWGTVGAGVRFVSWGKLDGYDENGDETQDFGAGHAALTLSFARADHARLRYGINVHVATSNVGAYEASALAMDVGVAYRVPERQFTVSASVAHLGPVLNHLGASIDRLPVDLRIGLSKRLAHLPLLLSLTGYDLQHVGAGSKGGTLVDQVLQHVAAGGEFQFSKAFHVRFGYNHRRHRNLATKNRLDLAGLSTGFGIEVMQFRFDYAFSSWSTLGGLHRLTLRTVI